MKSESKFIVSYGKLRGNNRNYVREYNKNLILTNFIGKSTLYSSEVLSSEGGGRKVCSEDFCHLKKMAA